MEANRVELSAEIVETDGLRHTPAGIPVLRMKLRHASRQVEAGHTRMTEFETMAEAFGDVAERLAKLAAPTRVRLIGFLDRTSARDPQPRLHATEFELISRS